VRGFPALLAFAWLAAAPARAAEDQAFAFAGFHRDMDLATLLDRYPQSAHDLTPGAGVPKRTSQDDEKTWMRNFFRARAGSGTYVLRLTPGESHDHLYYVHAEVRSGVTERLWLSLEMPLELMKSRPRVKPPESVNEARHPPCNDVLIPLTAKYGKPQALAPRSEEALQSFDYLWTRPRELMKLECGRYQGRKATFATGVTLERTASR
jgi:hypothetical protein